MERNTFFSNLLQNIGFISALAVAISQYAINDSFGFFFEGNEKLFRASSLSALIISIAIILGIFVLRFHLLNKIYLEFWNVKDYRQKLNKISKEKNRILTEEGERAAQDYQNTTIWPNEPVSIKSIHLGFIFLILALICFVLLTKQDTIWITALSFILFISLTVAAISIFSVQLYRDNEYKQRREETTQEIYNKINEFFADKVTVITDYQDQTNLINPIRTIIIEHPSRGRYRVDCNAYDPSKLFSIKKIEEKQNITNKSQKK